MSRLAPAALSAPSGELARQIPENSERCPEYWSVALTASGIKRDKTRVVHDFLIHVHGFSVLFTLMFMDVHGLSLICQRFSLILRWKSMKHLWNSMIINQTATKISDKLMNIDENQRTIEEHPKIYENQWTYTEINENPWTTLGISVAFPVVSAPWDQPCILLYR